MTIQHAAIEDKWHTAKVMELLLNCNTLILGSFNPNNTGNNTDFYYGRCSNYFWKIIAEIEQKNEQYYCNNIQRKVDAMEKFSFCFLDLIESIEISSTKSDLKLIEDFVQSKIYTGYSDSVLFTSNTVYKNTTINIKRNYNKLVLDILTKGKIDTVIHTLGNTTISKDFRTKPQEKAQGNKGFQGYLNSIIERNENIEFINESFSPSAYAVRKLSKTNYSNMKSWFEKHLIKI